MEKGSKDTISKGCIRGLELLASIATIVACCVGIFVIPEVRQIITKFENPKNQPIAISSPTSEPNGFPTNTPKDSILAPGEIWVLNDVELRVKNVTFQPGCDGILGFELSFVNTDYNYANVYFSGSEIVVIDSNKNYYPNILWDDASLSQACFNNLLDQLHFDAIGPNGRWDFAFRVSGQQPPTGTTLFIKVLRIGEIENATWKVTVP